MKKWKKVIACVMGAILVFGSVNTGGLSVTNAAVEPAPEKTQYFIDDASPVITYTGGIEDHLMTEATHPNVATNMYKGTGHWTAADTTTASTISFKFYGTGFQIIANTYENAGAADNAAGNINSIRVDGDEMVETAFTCITGNSAYSQNVKEITGLTEGTHQVVISIQAGMKLEFDGIMAIHSGGNDSSERINLYKAVSSASISETDYTTKSWSKHGAEFLEAVKTACDIIVTASTSEDALTAMDAFNTAKGRLVPYTDPRIPQSQMAAYSNSQNVIRNIKEGPAALALDGNTGTWWHTNYDGSNDPNRDVGIINNSNIAKVEFLVKLDPNNTPQDIGKLTIQGRTDGNANFIRNYSIYLTTSTDESTVLTQTSAKEFYNQTVWGEAVATGTLENNQNVQEIDLRDDDGNVRSATYLLIKVGSSYHANKHVTIAELNVYREFLDLSKLNAALADAALSSTAYTPDSYAILTAAIESALSVANGRATQDEVDAEVVSLRAAIAQLVSIHENVPTDFSLASLRARARSQFSGGTQAATAIGLDMDFSGHKFDGTDASVYNGTAEQRKALDYMRTTTTGGTIILKFKTTTAGTILGLGSSLSSNDGSNITFKVLTDGRLRVVVRNGKDDACKGGFSTSEMKIPRNVTSTLLDGKWHTFAITFPSDTSANKIRTSIDGYADFWPTELNWNPAEGVWLDDCPSTVADQSIKNLIIGGTYGTVDTYPNVGNFTGEIAYITIIGEEIPPASQTGGVDLLPKLSAPTQDKYTITYKKDADDVTPATSQVSVVAANTETSPSTITFDETAEKTVSDNTIYRWIKAASSGTIAAPKGEAIAVTEDITFVPEAIESSVFTNGGGSIRFATEGIESGLRMKTSIPIAVANTVGAITPENKNTYQVTEYGLIAAKTATVGEENKNNITLSTGRISAQAAFSSADSKDTYFEITETAKAITGVLYGITPANYSSEYVMRPYMKYKDGAGREYCIYGETQGRTIKNVAQAALDDTNASYNDEQTTYLNSIVNATE